MVTACTDLISVKSSIVTNVHKSVNTVLRHFLYSSFRFQKPACFMRNRVVYPLGNPQHASIVITRWMEDSADKVCSVPRNYDRVSHQCREQIQRCGSRRVQYSDDKSNYSHTYLRRLICNYTRLYYIRPQGVSNLGQTSAFLTYCLSYES